MRRNDENNGTFTSYNSIQRTVASVQPWSLIYIKKIMLCVPPVFVPLYPASYVCGF